MLRSVVCSAALSTLLAAPPVGTPVEGTPFVRYTADGGQVTFYLSAGTLRPAPIVLFVQGTGCGSPFVRENGRILSGLQSVLHEASQGTARVMIVEKPGVQYLDNPAQPADHRHCRPEFVRQ